MLLYICVKINTTIFQSLPKVEQEENTSKIILWGQYYPDNKNQIMTLNEMKTIDQDHWWTQMKKFLIKYQQNFSNLRTHWKNYTPWLIANAIHHISRMKDKFNVLISKMQKKFDRIYNCFMINILNRLGRERTHPNTIKIINYEHIANIIFSGEKIETIFSKIWSKIKGAFSSILFNIVLEIHARAIS